MHECVTPDVFIPERSGPVLARDHGPLYDTILSQKSLLQNVSYICFFAIYRFSFFFVCLILCIRFVFGIFARFKPKKSHARRSRHDHCSSLRVSLTSLRLSCFFIHIHLSRLHAQFAAIHTQRMRMHIYV